MNIDWEIVVTRIGKACVWSAIAAFVAYQVVSRTVIWWVLRRDLHPDGQVGLSGFLAGLTAGAVVAIVVFCGSLYASTFPKNKPYE